MPLSSAEIEKTMRQISDLIKELEPIFNKKKPDNLLTKIRFPRGVIHKAEDYRSKIYIVQNKTLKDNIAYSCQLADVYLWILRWFDIDLTAKQMLLKHGIVLFASIIEAITYYFVDKYLDVNVHKKFKKNLQKLLENKIITQKEHDDFDRCRCLRDKLHIQNLFIREWEEYEEKDFYFALGCVNKINKILTNNLRQAKE